MNLKKLFSIKFWHIDRNKFREYYNYDLKFNAEFRGHDNGILSKWEYQLPQIKYLRYYRLTQAAYGTIWYRIYMPLLRRYSFKTGIGLCDNMNIPKGLIIGHEGRIVINDEVKFKGNVFLTHGVTIGRDIRGKRKGAPIFGKDVCIRCNSSIVGKIVIGDDVLIAPNTFVNFDVPSHSIVIGNPATIHHCDWATEGHLGESLS